MPNLSLIALAFVLLLPAASDDKLLVTTGHDDDTATDYAVFSLLGESHATISDSAAPPYLTFQCRQTAGKRHIDLFVDFGGIGNRAYHPPDKPDPITGFPQERPNIALKMIFAGYITSKPYKRTWAQFPNGELQYRNPGSYSPNLEEARYFLAWMASLPVLKIVDARDSTKSAEFQTTALVDQLRRNPLCQR
jgi:hypothetical protein